MTNPEILREIEELIASRNPLAVLLSITKIREMVLDLGDSLINGVESSYYDDTAAKFFELTDLYREAGYYKVMYAYYLDTGRFAEQKAYLDRYFEESYYRDPDFYFFVLDKHPFYRLQFEALRLFVADPKNADRYRSLTTPEVKRAFLESFPDLRENFGKDFL